MRKTVDTIEALLDDPTATKVSPYAAWFDRDGIDRDTRKLAQLRRAIELFDDLNPS